jgi:purine catabolism regulator
MWGPLPLAPVRLVRVQAPAHRVDALTELLELRAQDRPGSLFFARHDGVVVLCVSPVESENVRDLCAAFEAHAGVSDPGSYAALSHAMAQAERALERALEGPAGVVEFDAISRQGVLAFLARTDAREVGLATLAPLLAHDAAHGSKLVHTAGVWLENNGHFAAVADELGLHRHTVRARIGQVEQLLARDLSAFPARADLWAALLAAERTPDRPTTFPNVQAPNPQAPNP